MDKGKDGTSNELPAIMIVFAKKARASHRPVIAHPPDLQDACCFGKIQCHILILDTSIMFIDLHEKSRPVVRTVPSRRRGFSGLRFAACGRLGLAFFARPRIPNQCWLRVSAFCGISLICGVLVLAQIDTPGGPALPGRDILIDRVHANDTSDRGLLPGLYEYHSICGFRLAFDALKAAGVGIETHDSGRLTPEKLAGYRLLFLNLVSAEKEPFFVSEIMAVRDFVSAGGSLFVVTDHTNTYYHAHVLGPLMEELDIRMTKETVCEPGGHSLSSGVAWIRIERFKDHPVTEGLRRIAMQTAGSVDPRFAIAESSPDSWGDAWGVTEYGESNAPAFFGNWTREEGEPTGPLGVVLAREFGKGRIVIVADQNMLSDTFIHYADNYKLWFNAVAWLLHRPGLVDAAAYRSAKEPRLFLAEDFGRPFFGNDGPYGCYHAMILLSRYYPCFVNDRCETPCDLAVLANGAFSMDPGIIHELAKHVRSGRDLILLHTDEEAIEDRRSALSRLLKCLGVEKPAPEPLDSIEIRIPVADAGSIYLFRPTFALYNQALPSPTQEPKGLQRNIVDSFLLSIDKRLKAERHSPQLSH